MATTLRIDIADQPNHSKGRRRGIERGWTDEVLQMDLLSADEMADAERREVSLRAAGIALTHPCRARTSPRRGCRHPGHAADVARLREWLDGLGLLPVEVPEPEPEPARAKPVPRRPIPDLGWTERAGCRGEDIALFFGPDGERQPERDIRERKATAVCASCAVRLECLTYAMSRPEKEGVWGGLGEEKRATERRRWMRRPSHSGVRAITPSTDMEAS